MSKEHKAVCVIAWPAGHSRSPLIHNYWIKQHKLDAEYRREAVPPDRFAAFVENLRANGYIGANITVPHKEVALAMSEPDDRARAVVRLRHCQGDLLVWHGDICADIAVGAQILDKRRKPVGWHRFTPILSIELVLLDPIVVNQWGTRMTGRPGDDTDSFVFFTHYFATLCCFGDRCM